MAAFEGNRVLAHTGAKYPIIQAPMGWIARSQLASAVANAGGIGIIETSSGETDNCKAEIEKMASLTDGAFGVNLPIPDWAKDADGHWMLAYTGSIAFIVNKKLVKDIPTSWADLQQGQYKVAIGDVSAAAQAVNGVLAAAIAGGGDEKNIQPGLDFFAKLAEQGRLSLSNPTIQTLEKGEVEVGVVWDFNGLSYRDQIDPSRFEVLIPSDGSVISGYSTIINKYAKHPNAAKLTREYILSDAGQINLAKGNARPIRADHLTLPAEVQAKLLPNAQYAKVRPIMDAAAWEATSKALPQLWQEHVIINME